MVLIGYRMAIGSLQDHPILSLCEGFLSYTEKVVVLKSIAKAVVFHHCDVKLTDRTEQGEAYLNPWRTQ